LLLLSGAATWLATSAGRGWLSDPIGWRRLGVALAVVVVGLLGWLTHLRNSQYREPVAFWRHHLRHAPEHPRVWMQLGKIFHQREQPQRAKRAFERAVEARPDYTPASMALARLAMKRRDWDRAERLLRDGLEHRPAHPDLNHLLYGVLRRAERYDKARTHLRRCLERTEGPARAEYRALLGDLLLLRGDLDRAQSVLAELVQDGSAPVDAWVGMAQLHQRRDEHEQARAVLRRGLDEHPEAFMLRLMLGESLLKADRPGQAREHLRRAVELNPSHGPAKRSLRLAEMALQKNP
jgi:tetratricopeptide (TPR) repeat protein